MKKKLVVILAVIILVVIAVVAIKKKANGDQYRKVVVTEGNIQVTVLSTGFVQPENRLEIKPQVSGRVESVLVKEGQYVKKGQKLAMVSSTERAALIDAARARGVEEQKKWEAYYKSMPILAPIDGTIILRSIEPGQTFTTQDAVIVMSDRLTVKAQVDETDIAKVHLNQKANIVLDAYPNKIIPAIIDQIAYDATTINSVTTYIVDVLPIKAPEFMLSGMTANVTFFVQSKENILTLTTEAIKNKDNYLYVLVHDSKLDKIAEKKIEAGLSDGKNVEIISGLSKDEVVLIPIIKTNDKNKQKNPFSPSRPKN